MLYILFYIFSLIKSHRTCQHRVFIPAAAVCIASFAFSDWPVNGGNIYHTCNNDEIGPRSNAVFWSYQAAGKIFFPIVSDGIIYFTDQPGNLTGIDEETGKEIFVTRLLYPSIRECIVYGPYLFSADRLWLTCLNKKTGVVIWARKDYDNGIYASPTVSENSVYYGSRSRLFAKNIENGHDRWKTPPEISFWGGFPCPDGGRLYLNSRNISSKTADIHCLNIYTGEPIWCTSLPYSLTSSAPFAAGHRLYTSADNELICLNKETGGFIFKKKYSDYILNQPAFTDRAIILSLRNGSIVRVNPADGEVLSIINTGYSTAVYMLLIRDVIYTAGTEARQYQGKTSLVSRLNGYTLTDGSLNFQFESPTAGNAGRPIASRGRIIFPVESILYSIGEEGEKSIRGKDDAAKDSLLTLKVPDNLPPGTMIEAITRSHGKETRTNFSPPFSGNKDPASLPVPGEGDTELLISAPDHMSRRILINEDTKKIGQPTADISLDKIEINKSYVVDNLLFQYNKAVLDADSIPLLEKIRQMLLENKNLTIDIRGYTDNIGSEAYNLGLSVRRADAVREYLIKNGIFQDRLTSQGFGISNPIADNSTEEGRAKNRRVEFFIIRK